MTQASVLPPNIVQRMLTRIPVILFLLAVIATTALFVGVRYSLILALGLAIGLTLEGLRFGFAGPWRAMILRREPAGLIAQLLAIGGVALVAFPILSMAPSEVVGAHAPVGFAMMAGAFIFGISMQLVLGCGSGTLVNAGSGNAVALVALPFFAIGSFAGAYHLDFWIGLGTAPTTTLPDMAGGTLPGLIITLFALAVIAVIALKLAKPENRHIPKRLWWAAAIVAGLAILHLVVAGQPWGVVYGLGLWAAKTTQLLGFDLAASSFWAAPGQIERLQNSIFTDITSLTNIGLILGAFAVASWRGDLQNKRASLPMIGWITAIAAGLLMGYSSRLAFGCNVGAFFSGVSTGSLHGWVWFIAAFAGSIIGIRLRPHLGLEAKS